MKIFFSAVLLFAGINTHAGDDFYITETGPNELKIMSYNVQNLFDADHDKGKNDYEFLPINSPLKKYCDPDQVNKSDLMFVGLLFDDDFTWQCKNTDWTDEKVEWKLDQIYDALEAQGDFPDILILTEVENPHVVQRLARKLKYDSFYMTDSPDARGIDTAILYREDKLTPLDYVQVVVDDTSYPTRNASAGHFQLSDKLGGGILGIYPVHWPSLRGPTIERIRAAKAVRALVNKQKRKFSTGKPYSAIVLGDFNTSDADDKPHPINSVILDKRWSPGFQDVQVLAADAYPKNVSKMPLATYYYGTDKVWNHFDRILVTEPLTDGEGLDVELDSFRIHAPSLVSKENDAGERIPFRYNHRTDNRRWLGYSDHFAVHVKLKYSK